MTETAPDRVARLLALVSYLRDHPAVPVTQVADHFGVTETQIHKDINTLWVSGTPGYMHGDLLDFASDDYEHGVLTLLNSQEMDRPLRLAPGEAVALLVGLQSLSATLDPAHAELVQETAQVLRSAAGQAASAADAVQVTLRSADLDARIATVRRALSRRQRLHLRYVAATDAVSERDVDPLQLLTDTHRWFLIGWCYRAQEVRQFRLDRILAIELLDVDAESHDVELRDRTAPDTTLASNVTIEVAARARWLVERIPDARIVDLDDGWISVTFGVLEDAWFANLVFALGPLLRSVNPASAAAALRQRASAAVDAYAAMDLLE